MFCNKCGNELKEDMNFCNKCGAQKINADNDLKEQNINGHNKKIKFNVGDVVNRSSILNSTNKVACIANGWALQVKKRGDTLALIIAIIYFFIAISSATNVPYYSGESEAGVFFATFGIGVLYAVIVAAVFNTIAFIIRMGAEVIQLLDDIKNK